MDYWLTEAAALKVCAKSETEIAYRMLDEIIRVFVLARRGELPGQSLAISQEVAQLRAGMASLAEQMEGLRESVSARLDAASTGAIAPERLAELLELRDQAAGALYRAGRYKTLGRAKAAVLMGALKAFGWPQKGQCLKDLPACLFLPVRRALVVAVDEALAAEREARQPQLWIRSAAIRNQAAAS